MGPPARLIAFMLAAAAHTACGSTLVANKSTDDFEGGSGPALYEVTESPSTATITVLMTRHAFSCANAVKQFMPLSHSAKGIFSVTEYLNPFNAFSKLHTLITDPKLTNCGAYASESRRELILAKVKAAKLPPVTHVLSSQLMRAMETAYLMYGGRVVPVPFISESGRGYNNSKKALDVQRAAMKKIPIDFQWLEHKDYHDTKPSWPDFQTFMAQTYLPSLSLKHNDRITIALVTHSTFMKKLDFFEKLGCKKPDNNAVFRFDFKHQWGTDDKGNAIPNTFELAEEPKEGDTCVPFLGGHAVPDKLCRGSGVDDLGCEGDLVNTPISTEDPGDDYSKCCTTGGGGTVGEGDKKSNKKDNSKNKSKNKKNQAQSVRSRIRRMLLRKVLRAIRKQAH